MSFPANPRDLKVGAAFGSSANEDPTGLMFEIVSPNEADDTDPGPVLDTVTITRGRVGDAPTTNATTIETSLRDTDGDFSPRNVSGAHYGQLLMDTPVQVSVDIGSGDQVLGTAYQPDWNPLWDGPDINDRVPVNAVGILAVLGRDRETKSALRRYIESQDPTAFWPMDTATSGTTEMGAVHLDGSGVVPEWTTAQMSGVLELGWSSVGRSVFIRPVSGGTQTIGAEITTAVAFNCMIRGRPNELGDAPGFTLNFRDINPITWAITVSAYWAGGSPDLELSSGAGFIAAASDADAAKMWDEGAHHVGVYLEQAGANVSVQVYVDGTLAISGSAPSMTLDGPFQSGLIVGNGADVVWSHVAVWAGAGPSASDFYQAATGHVSEQAAARVARVCAEAGIAADVAPGDSATMGPQPIGTILAILRDCEAADHGVLSERRDGRVGYDPLSSRYNVTVAMALEYGTEVETGDISDLLQLDDRRDLFNQVTVTRAGGSSSTATETAGPVGTAAIGIRRLPVTLNLSDDSGLPHHAAYLLRAGTIDKPRYVIVLDLYANPGIADDWLATDLGSRITIAGAPAKHVGPDLLDLIIEGEKIKLGADVWRVVLWSEPYEPFRVQQLAETPPDDDMLDGWLIPDTFALRAAVDSDDTSWAVDIFPRMTTDADDFPCRIVVAGEECAITAVATTAATIVTVGAADHDDNAAVTPADYAGGAVGDWIVVEAGSRDTSSPTLAITDANYDFEEIGRQGGLYVWAAFRTASAPAPTVTPTGGAAGDTVSAIVYGLRNMPITGSPSDWVLASVGQTNSSAQNIAYGSVPAGGYAGRIVLFFARKSDDWTSASISGPFEITETTTTSGNDQSLYAAYRIDTTPTAVDAASITVTGGASAVSDSLVIALQGGYQTLTVTRSVNGVEKSHAAGTDIELLDALVASL